MGTSVEPVVTDSNRQGSAAAAETVLLQHNHSTFQSPPSPQAPSSLYVGGQQSGVAETVRELSGVAAADTAVVAVVSVPAPVEGGGADSISTHGAARKAGGGGGVSQTDLVRPCADVFRATWGCDGGKNERKCKRSRRRCPSDGEVDIRTRDIIQTVDSQFQVISAWIVRSQTKDSVCVAVAAVSVTCVYLGTP